MTDIQMALILRELNEGDLLIIAYKLADNRIPPDGKNHLIDFIVQKINQAGKQLQGQTLPADLDKINKIG